MMSLKINLNNLTLYSILFISIFPAMSVGSFTMPTLYLLIPIGVAVIFLILIGKIKIPNIVKIQIVIFFLIIIAIFITTLYGTVTAFNRFIFPTDSIQYIARFAFLVTFIVVFYHGKVKANIFIKYFLFFLNVGMLIGILQWIPGPTRELFVNLYPYREGLEQAAQINRDLSTFRVHGIAQFATANGGLATLSYIFSYSVFKYYKKYKFSTITLMLFSIINIFASQARAGMLALVFAIFLFYLVDMYTTGKSFRPTIYMLSFTGVFYLFGWYLYVSGNAVVNMMIQRWRNLFDAGGGARVDQISYSLGLLDNTMQYFWGISRAFQSHSGLGFFIEVEPVNIFVLYGIVGFSLQYSLIFILLFYLLSNIKKVDDSTTVTLLVAAFVGLASYQVFSTGYFFYREIRVGLFPWILIGVAIGVFERKKMEYQTVK